MSRVNGNFSSSYLSQEITTRPITSAAPAMRWTMASQLDNSTENKLKEAFNSWNPLEEDYEDPNFNTYHTGPGAYLNLNLQPFNKRSRDSGAHYKLFVSNIPRTITQKGFVNYFYSFGEPFDVALINNGQGTHNFGFISYKTEKDVFNMCLLLREAELAIREVHRQPPLHLRVGFSRSEEEKTRLLKKSQEEEAILRAVNEIGPLERPVSNPSFKLVSRGRGKPPGYIPRRPGFQANKAWCLSELVEGDWYRPTIENSYNMSNRFILEELANNTSIVGNRRVGMGRAYLPKEEVPRNVFSHVGSHKLVKKIKKNGDVACVHGCKIPVTRGLCYVCQKKTTLKCTRCGTWYCSSNCQIDHWPVHKAQCLAKSSFTPTNMMRGVTQDPQCAPLSRGRGKLLSSILEDARRSCSLESPTARKKDNSGQVLLDKSQADSEINPHMTTENSIVPKLSSNMKGSLQCKLAFCKTIADECQPFLQRFQTSKPMTPYLFEAVEKLLRYLMNRCVKPDLMKCTGPKLLSIDTKKSENLILSKNIDIGFATKRLLGETAITVTERQKLEFIHECRSMLTTMIAKLQEKSPLKQKAVRGLSSLDPCVIQHSPQLAQKRFSFLLEELNHANIINDVLAENAKKEYLHFCNLKKSELQEIFRPCDQFSDEVGLDTIYGSFLIGEANYKHLWEVIKICLVLSHGNATVEGGFSVNKSLLVENMHEKTVIAQRHIHDEIQEAGGIKNIHISKKMLDYVRGARKRYHEYLEMKKQEKSEKDKKKAEKRKLDIQVKDLEGERKKLMMATEEKREAIDVELQELKKKQASLY
uniref:MYND-type domain-containing protein n=1 Tax=Timema monikensis TaxID=170555 RepID=A0A7R9ECR0_9NEOP|nr:unnamed protein product [Timema monikensis]